MSKNQQSGKPLVLRCNEDGVWEKYEPYMTIECPTVEDFEYLKAAMEKQHKEKVILTEDNCFCPRCNFDMMGVYDYPENAETDPKYCPECGQALDWEERR